MSIEQLSDSQNLANEGALQQVDEAYLVERTTSSREKPYEEQRQAENQEILVGRCM